MAAKSLCKDVCELYPIHCPHAADELTTVFDHIIGDGANCPDLVMKKGKNKNREKDKTPKDTVKEIIPEDIINKAKDILKNGDPFQYIMDTWSRMHVGDQAIGQLCLAAITTTMISNTDGLHIKPHGESGKGKSDAISSILHLLPKEKYISGSLSGKALFYLSDDEKRPGTIIFSDDVKLNEDIITTIKQTTSNYQQSYTHRTVSKDREGEVLEIPARQSWWLTSVEGFEDDQMGNRFMSKGVDSTTEQDEKVKQRQVELEMKGITGDTVDDDVLVCRAIFQLLEGLYKVVIPFVASIVWGNPENRRNQPMFFDIIKAVTLYKKEQRKVFKGAYKATEEDFNRAKIIYDEYAEINATNLTERESKIIEFLANKNVYKKDIREIQIYLGISRTAARNLLHGRNGKGGLLKKVPGLQHSKDSETTDDGTKTIKSYYWYEGTRDKKTYTDIISLNESTVNNSIIQFKEMYKGGDNGD